MHEPTDLLDPAHYAAVRRPAESARPLPNWCYTSPAFYALEVERIFMKAWNYVGHASRIPEPGDFFTTEIAGAPVIVITGDDGEVRAFHNSCRHRGSRLVDGEGRCRLLTCPYHAWAYARDGRLVATPRIDEDEHLRHADLGLLPVRLERWHGFLFVNFDDDAAPLADWLGDLPDNCASYGPEDMVCTRRKSYDVAANWKLYFENYNDSLHIPFVHGGTLNRQGVSGRKRASHEECDGEYIVHFTSHEGSRGLLKGETGFPPIASLEGRHTAGTYYPCILPTTLMGWTVDCLWVYQVNPTGPTSLRLDAESFFPRDRLTRNDFEDVAPRYYARVDTVLPEDNEAVQTQQLGLRGPVTAASRFTHMETLCHAFDNWVLDRVVGR